MLRGDWGKVNKILNIGKTPWNKDKPLIQIQGANHWNWRGGITSLNLQIRGALASEEWRKAVFERDNYTCIECGKTKIFLEADHIKPFALIVAENNIKTLKEALSCEELWDINNGRTLCRECHRKTSTHGYNVRRMLNERRVIQ